MKLNVKFNLQNKNAKRQTIIMLSITWEGNRLQLSTGMSIAPNDWNLIRQRTKPNYRFAFEINRYLEKISDEVSQFYFQRKAAQENVTKADMKAKVGQILNNDQPKESNFGFWDVLDIFIEERIKSKKYTFSTLKKYKNIRNHLKNFKDKRWVEISFENMNKEFSDAFLKYLIYEKNLVSNAAIKVLKVLKVFLNDSFERGYSNNTDFIRAFRKSIKEYGGTKDVDLIALEESELEAIENFIPEQEKLKKVKDLFLFQNYTGLRVSDLLNLKPIDININAGKIVLHTIKTETPVIIPIHSKLKQLLGRYPNLELPKSSSQKYNGQYPNTRTLS